MVQLHLPGYDGPLALLLQLIEEKELDVSELSLVQVTDQYMEHMEQLKAWGAGDLADSLGEFIVIGGKLMLLKSRAMLPREVESDSLEEDDDDVGRELVEMLEEYRRYREAVTVLGTIDRSGLRSFRPGAPPPVQTAPPAGLPDSVTLDLLSKLVREALARADQQAKRAPEVKLEREPLTVKDKIADLQRRLRGGHPVSFRAWIAEARTRVDVIVTFLAILEMYKSREIDMRQAEVYGDILVVPKASAARVGGAD